MKVVLFIEIFFLYLPEHSVKYAYTRAIEIAFKGYPF